MRPSWIETEFSKASRALFEAYEAIEEIRVRLTSGGQQVSMGGVTRYGFPADTEEVEPEGFTNDDVGGYSRAVR